MIHAGCNYFHNGEIVYVKGVNLATEYAMIDTKEGTDSVQFDQLKPIPITPDIMAKLGAEKIGENKYILLEYRFYYGVTDPCQKEISMRYGNNFENFFELSNLQLFFQYLYKEPPKISVP